MAFYDVDDLIASGQIDIAGWAPTGNPGLVTAGADDLSSLLAAAAGMGMDELDGLDAAGCPASAARPARPTPP